MKKIIITSICLLFLFTGCSIELTKYVDNNTCLTTIEGNYFKENTSKFGSAVFVKTTNAPRMVKGKVISLDSSGVLFDPDKTGFYNEEESVMPYDTLYGVVDERGKIVYGQVPSQIAVRHKLQIWIEKEDTKAISELLLEPNEPFAYCIEPGRYKVIQIKFIQSNMIEDVGHNYPKITLNIEEGKANYLGNVYADFRTKDEPNVIIIPSDRDDARGAATAGLFGGLIGAVVYSVVSDIASSDYYHTIHMEIDKNFLPEANIPVSEISIEIQATD